MSYILDANSYIQAKNFHYRMGFCPGFWDWLDSEFKNGQIASVFMVYKELSEFGDDLSDWVKKRPDHFLSIDDENTQKMYATVADHVMGMRLPKEAEKMRFLSGADPWLISKAATTGYTIVTHEVLVPDNSQKIKIPNLCKNFGVPYITSFDLLDTLGAKLIIDDSKKN
ncbi:TPA: DUF4411 family protein [Pseudomonas aeruginosa]|uniref:DUF4411 family protein n=1 Tax=Pseudomonas aeruginosa TaxID=287 RepID=UPI0002CBC6D4|nr:DUF4411 family protein [Pseudomonas aeruginosa]ENH93600.1 hypothetical protein H734_09072 [Pseudomonas aeruginosa PA45]MBH4203515.1 DUF4411 family protein [Pseudomonas aeruginosa]MBX6041170.1 DUF4411 family protein [Pseudomonas aeruginosa]MBX6651358.1 DUF4411 family protein [Pseudomonas aeruginosa]MBX6806330.1 DUF4411 family protein [Pseudomonas aeruginosa]